MDTKISGYIRQKYTFLCSKEVWPPNGAVWWPARSARDSYQKSQSCHFMLSPPAPPKIKLFAATVDKFNIIISN